MAGARGSGRTPVAGKGAQAGWGVGAGGADLPAADRAEAGGDLLLHGIGFGRIRRNERGRQAAELLRWVFQAFNNRVAVSVGRSIATSSPVLCERVAPLHRSPHLPTARSLARTGQTMEGSIHPRGRRGNRGLMQLHKDWRSLPPEVRGATVALGNFDGVHRGHAQVVASAMRRGRARRAPC